MEHLNFTSINMELTGNKIKEAIENSEFEESEIAEYLMVSDRTIKYWKSGRKLPSLDNLFELSKILDTEVTNLISFEYENSEHDLTDLLKEMSGDNPAPFMHYYRKTFKISTIEDFLAFLPLYNEEVLNDVLYRISGESVDNGTYMLEKLQYLYNNIENEVERDRISKSLERGETPWNLRKILAIVDQRIYEMALMCSRAEKKQLKEYVCDLVEQDFQKRGFEISEWMLRNFERMESLNSIEEDILEIVDLLGTNLFE